MADLTADQSSLLRQLAKAVVHLREQIDQKRFGLVFGAGIGKDLQFPSWDELIVRIANHPSVQGSDVVGEIKGTDNSLTIKIQRLYEWYKNKIPRKAEIKSIDDKIAVANWREILRDCLYEKVLGNATSSHPYLGAFEPLIKSSDVTINFNFDDTLQTMLGKSDSETDETLRKNSKLCQKVRCDHGKITRLSIIQTVFFQGISWNLATGLY